MANIHQFLSLVVEPKFFIDLCRRWQTFPVKKSRTPDLEGMPSLRKRHIILRHVLSVFKEFAKAPWLRL